MSSPLPAPIETLFLRFPTLYGFSVHGCDDDDGLFVDLVAEEPDAEDILRGRTFARVLH
jgi:hypothetical protein